LRISYFKEKDLREIKQFGFDSEWAQHGKTSTIVYPDPIKTRPRIGARYFIRQQIRKFLNALYREVKDLDFGFLIILFLTFRE
jgi:hypothetical protein